MKEARDKYKLQLSYVPLYTFSDNKLKVIYNNVRSYKRHYNDVKNNYDILSADVVVVAETWLSSKDKTENYSIQGYNAYCMDQHSTAHSHHGLIVYARNCIAIHDVKKFPGQHMEAISVVIQKGILWYNLVGVYISPHTSVEKLHGFLDNILNQVEGLPITIIGDFNVNVPVGSNVPLCTYMKGCTILINW